MATQKTERDGKTLSWILGMYRVAQMCSDYRGNMLNVECQVNFLTLCM